MDLQNTVKEALNALYHHPDDTVRTQADRWLQDFQHSIDAWQVADNFLHDASSNIETLIFCSQTLRYKVQRDFEELPSEAFRPLRDSLYTLLKKLSKGPPKVRTQICIAVAALAVHVSIENWGNGGVINWISCEMKSHPEYIPSFLELLTVLPEESSNYKIAARPERRRQFEKELSSSAEVAFDLLTACLGFEELRQQVLEAFASWLRLSYGIPASTLASHPLVHAALSSLNSDQFLEPAVNVISELIHLSVLGSSGGFSTQMPLIQILVPRVMGLKDQLKDDSKDEEDVKAIARLFADMGDSYVELIATGSEESMLIVQALLEVASHPDYDISSMTYNFWHYLQINLTGRDAYSSNNSEATVEAERSRRLQVFRPSYEMLVSLVSYRVEYPLDYQNLSEEDHRDLKHTRFAVSDVLVDATAVLGGEVTLRILFMKLVQAVGSCNNNENIKWQPVEAALYCIQAIAQWVPTLEAEVMPQIMTLFPKLPHQPQLLQTVCSTIGAYSKWINAAPTELSILPSLVDILTRGMSTSEDSSAAAAVAFKYICEDCRKQFSGSLDGLFHIYHIAVSGEGGYKISAEDCMHLVEALSAVITELPMDHAKKGLELVCLPSITPLQEIINQGGAAVQQLPAKQLTVHIDRLACVFRNVNLPEVVADAIQKFWPIFKSVFDQRAWDMRTMESLCRACKYAALVEVAEEKRKLNSNSSSNSGLEDLENDPLAEVFGSDKKRNYCRAVSSTSSVKQVRMTQAVKAVAEKKQVTDLSSWKLEIERQVANQVNDAIKTITSTFMKFIPNLQEKHIASPMETPHTEGASNLGDSQINNNQVVTPNISHNDIHSSTREKKYVMLLSQDLETDVAKGYVGTQTTCHFRKVIPNVEKVIWVVEVLEPDAPIYDGPQHGMHKLCELSDGGFIIWPEFRIRYL